MSARDDYPMLANVARASSSAQVSPDVARRALDEIDRLRAMVVRLSGENTRLTHAKAFEELAES